MLFIPGGMFLNPKQGSSLLDDDEEDSSSMGGLQHQKQPSSAAISGGVAEEEVSDHDTEEDSDEYYEEEDDDNGDDEEEGNDDEEITERVLTENEKEDDVGPFSNDTVDSSVQLVEDHYTKETDDALSSSAVGSDPKMSMLSNFLKRSTTTKTTTQEKVEEVTVSSSGESVSDEIPVSPSMSDAGATSAASSSSSPPASQPVLEEPVLLQTSPPPTEKRTLERKEGAAIIRQEDSHNVFSDDEYEFFSTYLNEGDDKIDFEHASRESFDAPAIAKITDAIYEQDADGELDDEDGGTGDVFKPTIPIEEQFLIQEERAAIRSAASLAGTFNNNDSKNIAKSSSRGLPPPSFTGALANTGEEERHHKKPLPITKVSPQPLPPQISPVPCLPPLPVNVLSAAFPPQKYSFTSARKDLEVDYEEEGEGEGEGDEDSRVCSPSYTSEVEMHPPPPPPPLPPQASPGLIAEAGAAASKIMSQVESNADKLKRMAFAIKVKMLREETKGLHCNKLVDILFGEDDDNLKMPSLEMRKKLKKAIDIELTVKQFMDYKAVVDINTAELFMKDKSALEDICRQQVMSNPLLSSLDYDNSIPNNNNKSKTKILTSESPLENESDSASIVNENNAVATTAAALVVATPQVVLYQELTDIVTNSSKNTDPATRLTNKISFLKKMLAFKIGNTCNTSKILNLSSFIVKQAINTIGGGAAAERVLLHGGGSGGSFYSGAMGEDPSLSGAWIGLLFGTILGGVNSVIIRSCVSVARLAMTMGVPIVMLNWPQEFKVSKDYESILRESILKFKHTSNVSLSFILDSVFGVEEEEEEKETAINYPAAAVSILTNKEKAKIIRDSINKDNNYSDRDFFGSLFEGYYGYNSKKKQRGETLEMPIELLYQNASNVIEHKNRITDNMLSGIVEYLEENKILLSRILNNLISKASLAATVYYINSSSVKKANSVKKNNNAQKASARVNTGSGTPLKKLEWKGISSSGRTILTDNRRGVVGGGLSASRGRLRSMMPVIAAPQKITNAKPFRLSRYRRDSNDSDFNTDSDINSHLITDHQKEAFRQWVDAQ
uniref:Wsv313-like protein n=1 Tax=Hemigrapsus takanoi nimavirus TaxID=2133792 RepID=A0A401INZ9_9VIRU|nr:MAG: wsv313-like protein [Hemigrapsus takanoi nimavirus]GBG35349.1 wsv313-like protein [Hemigrapsus takanoi nimavirus]